MSTTTIHVVLPTDLKARLDRFLHNDLLGRVPYGALSALICQAVRDYLRNKGLESDLPDTATLLGVDNDT